MARKAKERGGGRLTRSETVTVRLDPRLNYLGELAARVERRTKSSFVEAMLDDKVHETLINPRFSGETIGGLADKLWHVEDYKRLLALAEHAPHLMKIDEQQIWAIIENADCFWSFPQGSLTKECAVHSSDMELDLELREEQVRELWPDILKVAAGEEDRKILPRRHGEWSKAEALGGHVPEQHRSKLSEKPDDDIPF